jgi:hypothetical protein
MVVLGVGAVTTIGPVTPIQEHALMYSAPPAQGVAYVGMEGAACLFFNVGS